MVRSREELAKACTWTLALIQEVSPEKWHSDRILARFEADREMMFVALVDETMIGAALGFRKDGEVIVGMLGVAEPCRRIGVGRRLLELIELQAMRVGAGLVSLGAVEGARPFYRRIGYVGKSSYHKQLPPPGRVLDVKLKRWAGSAGDVANGAKVCVDPRTGKLPAIQ